MLIALTLPRPVSAPLPFHDSLVYRKDKHQKQKGGNCPGDRAERSAHRRHSK